MLSVIIITKNEERFLPRLLDSIKNQTFKDYEIIVSDAFSTDRTREIALSYGCRVVDGGLPSIGRNNGAKYANGDIFLFLDADVILERDFFERALKEFKLKRLGCAIPFVLLTSNDVFDNAMFMFYNAWIYFITYIYPQGLGSCILCRRDAFFKSGGFDERVLFAEDSDFIRRISKVSKFRVLENSVIYTHPRRIKKEGRIRFIYKSISSAVYRFSGREIKKPFFEYELNGGVPIRKIANPNYVPIKSRISNLMKNLK